MSALCYAECIHFRKWSDLVNIILLGAAGFIGTNLTLALAKDPGHQITVVDRDLSYFQPVIRSKAPQVRLVVSSLTAEDDYETLLKGQDVVYHLISTTVPTTSNQAIAEELKANVVLSANLLEACVHQGVQKVVFISSGGTVYGKTQECPIPETAPTDPISSYGVQKITIEKLLYLYHCMYGLDYRIIRLANPYGPYQRPNGVLGAITTFTYKALCGEEIQVYGDGSVMRDFIYIDDAVRGILRIVDGNAKERLFNLGSGYGTSLRCVLDTIQKTLDIPVKVSYAQGRGVDVPVNYLDISRYEEAYEPLEPIPLEEGIQKTATFMKEYYHL